MRNLEDEEGGLPYSVPQPTSADETAEVLFPTSPPIERPDPNDDSPLMPPLMDS